MTDIDFDELDKAVNSIMGNVKGGKDDVPKAKTLEVRDTLKPGEEPKYKHLDEVAQKIGNEALETEREQTLVEHFEPTESAEKPEYDKLGEIAKTIGSEALDTTPSEKPLAAPTATAELTESKPAEAAKPVESQPAPVDTVKTPAVKPAAGGRFMDVVHPSSDMRTAPAPSKPIVASSRLSITPPVHAPVATAVEDGAPTPFLPDANDKVEKRPLGAIPSPFSNESDETPAAAQEVTSHDPPVAETSSTSDTSETEKTETDEDTQLNLNAAAIAAEPTAEEKALQEIEAKEVNAEDLESKDESIEEVESGDTEHLREMTDPKHGKTKGHDANATGAIYNVDEYHKPLSHPKKQKSGWGKVLIIVLIIVIFAAFAGGAYFFLAGV